MANLNDTIQAIGADIKELKEQAKVAAALNDFTAVIQAANNAAANGNAGSLNGVEMRTIEIDTRNAPESAMYRYRIKIDPSWMGKTGVFIVFIGSYGQSVNPVPYACRNTTWKDTFDYQLRAGNYYHIVFIHRAEGFHTLPIAEKQGYPNQA